MSKTGRKLQNPEKHIEVRFCSPLGEDGQAWALGWYVFIHKTSELHTNNFRAILLRFRRKKDAEIARSSLIAVGLVTYSRVAKEPAINVLRIMCENLQW